VHAWLVPVGLDTRRLLAAAAADLLGVDPARVEVATEPGGRPVVRAAAGAAWVSLSHGPGVLAVAASLAGPVGIDVEGETVAPEVTELAGRWFTPAEADWLRDRPAASRPRDFLLLWTAKEALGKASGAGLRTAGLRTAGLRTAGLPTAGLSDAGLRRRVPLPPVVDGGFHPVPGAAHLAHLAYPAPHAHPAARAGLVLAVASGVAVPGLLVHDLIADDGLGQVAPDAGGGATGHVAARSTARSRLSLPVVVRGN
jgi:4'-phosphopantetheinyl transferase